MSCPNNLEGSSLLETDKKIYSLTLLLRIGQSKCGVVILSVPSYFYGGGQ